MWKLSLVIIFFWAINQEHINHKIIVLDNCTKWKQAYISKEPGEFAIVNDFDYNNPVLLSNVAHLGSPMEVRTITLKDVINIKEYVSSSE
ncbi:hypothetical protein LV83_00591 [Algoriphagus yeomjeoni]|uniref:Uncharacterized protein n=1 Tax=Algoriphagus yeomjeoni TaxID=291403 RepID=A0A327PSQ6_9BACT|nr:hypothetical protein LV83_00591 [Algoriphagus yeomjeoni]